MTSPPAGKTPEVETIEICFFFSRPGSKVFVPPDETLLEKIDIEYVRAGEIDEADHNFYIRIIEWVDWNTVIVDYGSVRGPLSGGGADGMKLQYIDGNWIIIDDGTDWIS